MANVFIYGADIYCEDCGKAICAKLKAKGKAPADPDDESTYDSGDYPKGPYGNGGGEADSPQHCGACHTFLENPLTGEGYAYVRETAQDRDSSTGAIREWLEFYDIDLSDGGFYA